MEAAIEVFGVPALAPKQKLAFERHCAGSFGKAHTAHLRMLRPEVDTAP